jgi:mono/diheme cytochrome c family protein
VLPAVVALLWLAVAVALAGCGGSGTAHPPAGQVLFARNCSGCHSLTGRNDPRRQGGDLLGFRVTRPEMLQFVREMPLRRRLSGSELAAVADYVLAAEGRARQ